MPKKKVLSGKIFDLDVFSGSIDELLKDVADGLRDFSGGKKTFIVTPNPEFIIASKSDKAFLKVLKKADLAIPDGIGLVWSRQVLKKKGFFPRLITGFLTGVKVLKGDFKDQVITGTDLMKTLCQLAAQKNWSVFLLGAKPGVAQKALKVLQKDYPGLVGWVDEGPREGVRVTPQEITNLVEKINRHRPDFLFVAFGMRKQEEFIWHNWPNLKVKIAMGVGGAFDYLSSFVPRAPISWRQSGFEWLYRLVNQPWRWRKQLALVKFIWLVLTS
jgi:N-acetylglucosaminyldiphosphoundecaprenol N-acetyl-beta-D-mannosaminyltransferase